MLDADRLLRNDLHDLVRIHDVSVLVTLLDDWEINAYLGQRFKKLVRQVGMEPVVFQIPDGWVPASMEETVSLVEAVIRCLRAGMVVVVHCLAGLGRTGTIAACCLVAGGRVPIDAITIVRDARPGSLQNEVQKQFVSGFAEAWRRHEPSQPPASP